MAEECIFDSAIISLKKPQETRRLLKILVVLRKEMEWPKDRWNIVKFHETGCVKRLFAAMQRDNVNILDVCLSILGNCVMHRDMAQSLVVQDNILPILNKLLTQHKDCDSVNGRVFRIIGNICRQWGSVIPTIFHREPELVKHIVNYLKKCSASDISYDFSATLNMGIRALRELTNRNTVDSLVSDYEVLQTVGLVLIKYTAKWQEDGMYETVLKNVVRVLYSYLSYNNPRTLGYLKNTGNGDALQCLSSIISLAPSDIVDIIMKLTKTTSLKSDLPIPEVCEALQKLIRQQVDRNKGGNLLKQYLQSLCILFTHPGNRPDDRNKGSIPFLIQILKELDLQAAYSALSDDANTNITNQSTYLSLMLQMECSVTIIMALQMCMYDENLVSLQVKHDIVGALVEKLEWITGTSDSLNLKHDIAGMPCWQAGGTPSKRKRLRLTTEYVNSIGVHAVVEYKPFSYLSVYSSSPTNSSSSDASHHVGPLERSTSPASSGSDRASTSMFYFDSDEDYSPVCSDSGLDNTGDVIDEVKRLLEEEIDNLSDEGGDTSKEKSVFKDKKLITMQQNLVSAVMELMRWFSKVRPVVPQMGTMRVMKALLKITKGISSTSKSDTVNVVMEILECQEYLLPLLQTDFVPMVSELLVLQHRKCSICLHYQQIGLLILRRLTILAQSGCGKGDIAHQLMRGSDTIKRKLILVLPFVIRNKSILAQFMITCGGLEILMKVLQEDTDQQQRSIKIICMMALKKLRIINPKNSIDADTTVEVKLPSDYTPPEDSQNLVTFILDDGATVSVDRDFLSEKSDYFNTLLYGQFIESQQDAIVLKNVDSRLFKCLLNLLNCDLKNSVLLNVDEDLRSLLDLILLADKFLFATLSNRLTECVEKFHMSTTTVSQIYQWSVESGTNILRVETVAYALVANITDDERFLMFKGLFDLGYLEQLVEDIRKLLERFLNVLL